MGSLEKPDDSTYGVYIHIVTYVLFIYSMHIYIYLYYIYVVFSLLYSFVFGRPKITISNLRQKTNQQRRTSQPHRHFLEPTKIRVEESEESRAQKTENQSPCLHQKRLQKVGKPKAFRISIHHGEQSRLHWHHHP